MLSNRSPIKTPCIRCDADALKVVNARAAKVKCVGIRFEATYCSSCEFMKAPRGWFSSWCCTRRRAEVNVGIPVKTWGTVTRAVEAARVAAKGTEFRAYGTLIHHLSLMNDDEVYKIALLRWLPWAYHQWAENGAELRLPVDALLYSDRGCEDYTRIKVDDRKYEARVAPVLRRLRRLREDEVLTDTARHLLRKRNVQIRKELETIMSTGDSDDIFQLGLVKLTDKPASQIVEAEPEEEVTLAITDTTALERYQQDFDRRLEEMAGEINRLTSILRDVGNRTPDTAQEAAVSSDVHVGVNSSSQSSTWSPTRPVHSREELLSHRHPSENEFGFGSMNRRQRRARRVERRS